MIVQLTRTKFLTKHLPCGFARVASGNGLNNPVFGLGFGARLHVFTHLCAGLQDRGINQITHDLLHVAADIANFGKLGCLNLDKGRAGQLGQTAADFGFTNAGWSDHQNIFRIYLIAQIG